MALLDHASPSGNITAEIVTIMIVQISHHGQLFLGRRVEESLFQPNSKEEGGSESMQLSTLPGMIQGFEFTTGYEIGNSSSVLFTLLLHDYVRPGNL